MQGEKKGLKSPAFPESLKTRRFLFWWPWRFLAALLGVEGWMTWPLEGVLMQQGGGSASLVSMQRTAPSWLECRPSPVSLPRSGPRSLPLSSVLCRPGLEICSDYFRDLHSVLLRLCGYFSRIYFPLHSQSHLALGFLSTLFFLW